VTDDVQKQLKPLSWRDIVVPITGRQVGFSHEMSKHKFQFRDNQFTEPTGRGEMTFRYSIPMLEGIARGPYANLFIKTLPKFFEAMLDRRPGPLNDPVHGLFQAQPVSYSETLDAAVRDGVKLEIDFIHSPNLDEAIVPGEGLKGVKSLAEDIDAMNAALPKQPWFQDLPEEGTLDLFTSLAAIGDQISLAGDQFAAKLDKVAYQMDTLTESIDSISDPDAWPFRDAAQNIKESALELKSSAVDPAKNIVKFTTKTAKTISAVAAELGISSEDLLKLNEELAAGAPIIPKGTVVLYNAP